MANEARTEKSRIDRIARRMRLNFIVIEVGCLLLTGAALIDLAFDFGWGADWAGVLTGIGICLATAVIYLLFKVIELTVRLTRFDL